MTSAAMHVSFFDLCEFVPLSDLVVSSSPFDIDLLQTKTQQLLQSLPSSFQKIEHSSLALLVWCALTHDEGVEGFSGLLLAIKDNDGVADNDGTFNITQIQH